MSLREILTYPDGRLRKISVPITTFDSKLHKLLNDMADTMYDAPGVGLAAPQVGESVRVIVFDVNFQEDKGRDIKEFVNPKIVVSEGMQLSEEGCLSVPGFTGSVKRKQKVIIEYLDRKGNRIVVEASGLLSRVLQHEIDHLDGVLFFDRMSKLKRSLFKRKVEKVLGFE